MSPIQALWDAVLYVCGTWSSRRKGIPGEVIQRMSPEARQALSQLKSEDIGPDKVRRDEASYFADTHESAQKERQRQERLDFDKKILKR